MPQKVDTERTLTIFDRVWKLAQVRGLYTFTRLAKAAHLSRSGISHLAKGHRNVGERSLRNLAAALDVPLETLSEGHEFDHYMDPSTYTPSSETDEGASRVQEVGPKEVQWRVAAHCGWCGTLLNERASACAVCGREIYWTPKPRLNSAARRVSSPERPQGCQTAP